MPPITAAAHVDSDPLGAEEYLHAARRNAGFDLASRIAVGHRIMVLQASNMIIEPDPAAFPLGMRPGLGRQRLKVGRVDFLEHLAAGLAELAQHPLVVEVGHALTDRGVDLRQAVENPVA
jgi:hypothetical protein